MKRILPLWVLVATAPGCTGHGVVVDAGVDAMDVSLDVPATDARETSVPAYCANDARPQYPDGPFDIAIGSVIPDLHFRDERGHDVAMHDYFTPCVAPAPLLIVRTLAMWSGSSRQAVRHTTRFRTHPNAGRLQVLDIVVLSQDDVPATADDLAAWRPRYDTMPDALVADPAYQIKPYLFGAPELPTTLFIDTSTMTIVDAMTPLSQDDPGFVVTRALAGMDGLPTPRTPAPTLVDERFTPDQWEMIQAMTPVPPPPPDPTNAHADDPAAAALGNLLFADAQLSPTNSVSCATCHVPTDHFADGRPTGVGVATGDRNTPSVFYAAYSRWLFWDGRADSLWSQALGPFENPREMNSSRLFIAHAVASRYSAQYVAVFGSLPDLSNTARFPTEGRPGDSAYDAMTAADQDAVTRVFVNVGKAIEAYERTLRPAASTFDRYAAGDFAALTPEVRDGLEQFVYDGCIGCHYGPRLTDDSFHNIGMPTGRQDHQPDRGRIDAIAVILASRFRADGPYSDAPTAAEHLRGLTVNDMMLGQFRTPALRGVTSTGPWGHGGTFTDMDSVMVHYATRATMPAVAGTTGPLDLHLPGFHRDTTYTGRFVALLQSMLAP